MASRSGLAKVKVVQLAHAEGLPLPSYQSADAAGLDLIAALPEDQPLTLKPGMHAMVPTGLVLELPRGTEGQVRPRSGLAARHGITVLNSPGTIDADYRGEVQVILVNHGDKRVKIARGERIAQLVIAPVQQVELTDGKSLTKTKRGSGGFGSTGTVAPVKKQIASRRPASKVASRKRLR